jgi:hypothetical protein
MPLKYITFITKNIFSRKSTTEVPSEYEKMSSDVSLSARAYLCACSADFISTWCDTCSHYKRIHSTLNLDTAMVTLKDLIPTFKKTHGISVTKTTRLKLRHTVTVYHQIQTHKLHVEFGGTHNYHCPVKS